MNRPITWTLRRQTDVFGNLSRVAPLPLYLIIPTLPTARQAVLALQSTDVCMHAYMQFTKVPLLVLLEMWV